MKGLSVRKFVKARKWGRLILVGMLVVTSLTTAENSASAYNLLGIRWAGTPASGCCAALNAQYASTFQPGDKAAFDNARSAWNGSSANVIFTSGSSALTVGDTVNSAVGWDGITNSTYNTCLSPLTGYCFVSSNV